MGVFWATGGGAGSGRTGPGSWRWGPALTRLPPGPPTPKFGTTKPEFPFPGRQSLWPSRQVTFLGGGGHHKGWPLRVGPCAWGQKETTTLRYQPRCGRRSTGTRSSRRGCLVLFWPESRSAWDMMSPLPPASCRPTLGHLFSRSWWERTWMLFTLALGMLLFP